MEKFDLVCVGAGVMSTNLAVMLKLLDPNLKIAIYERLDAAGKESSSAWNNAGTGHSAFCELNYTSEEADGTINMTKAEKVCKQFDLSRQFWAYLVQEGMIGDSSDFINPVPHHAWVRGKKNVDFLEKRWHAMKDHFMFEGMEFTRDHDKMKEWFPVIMENRPADEVLGATRMEEGTEMNFKALVDHYVRILREQYNTEINYNTDVKNVKKKGNEWNVTIKSNGTKKTVLADRVFIGGGGGALPVLQTVNIPEKDNYGGFPIGGQWLVCRNREIIEQHLAKVYSLADVGSPPMSVPHLDTRVIDGKRELLFGPYAVFSTKFLKEGSLFDLFKSVRFNNVGFMLDAFFKNLGLTKYLIKEVLKSKSRKVQDLRKFVIDAKDEDWDLLTAGQRVQIIKKQPKGGGGIQFGTEVVSNEDGTLTSLLGASPGASVAVYVMLDVMKKAFPELLQQHKSKMDNMIPFWDKDPYTDTEFYKRLRKETSKTLNLA